jgi:endonuclease/exonuclease/phosphatase family metal-dependent hydrolase
MQIVKRLLLLSVVVLLAGAAPAETFRVAFYNVENYLDQPTETRRFAKSDAAKAKVLESLLAEKPDVIGFAEMGSLSALLELQSSLKARGLDLPHYEHTPGFDTNIYVAVLSKFPITARRSVTNANFLLNGRRFQTSRGFSNVEIQVNPNYRFTMLVAHLKSKRQIATADEAEMRLEEAKILRGVVDQHLAAHPDANLMVVGDLNDTYNTPPVKEIIGRGRTKLTDTRPTERNGDNQPHPFNPNYFPRDISWTHFYGVEDSYSRIDYILLSPGMTKEWDKAGTYIPTISNWGIASDHRPLVATFATADKQ